MVTVEDGTLDLAASDPLLDEDLVVMLASHLDGSSNPAAMMVTRISSPSESSTTLPKMMLASG